MFKLFAFALILAVVAAAPAPEPKPEPKPGYFPYAYTAPFAYSAGLSYPVAYTGYSPTYYSSYASPYTYYKSAYVW